MEAPKSLSNTLWEIFSQLYFSYWKLRYVERFKSRQQVLKHLRIAHRWEPVSSSCIRVRGVWPEGDQAYGTSFSLRIHDPSENCKYVRLERASGNEVLEVYCYGGSILRNFLGNYYHFISADGRRKFKNVWFTD